MTTLHTAARQALPLLERDCASLLACHQDPQTGAIPANEPEVIAMYDEYVAAIAALRAALEAQQEPAFGWAIVCNKGTTAQVCARVRDFFGAVMEVEPFGPEDLQRRDREWPGLAPHRLVTLYAAPQPAIPPGFVLVPEEPTPEMCAAGVQALYSASVGDFETTGSEVRITYSAMLAARPQPKETK